MKNILMIATGGTIASKEGALGLTPAVTGEELAASVPGIKDICHLEILQLMNIDSTNMRPRQWLMIRDAIMENYNNYDGFVVLHGTDTMAYTASALSFMLENLSKPVILTGSQLPIGMLRTDGKENLITSIEIAAAKHPDGTAIVPEVCIFFENHLLRGNRTTKINAENFNAFRSYNYPSLATAGIHIKYEYDRIHKANPNVALKPHYLYDTNVVILTLFPGIQENMIRNILHTPRIAGSGA